jgi:hypothetical protein
MTIKMSMTCTRCHKEDVHEITDLATATAFEALQKRKITTLAKLEAFVATLPKEELPDFYAVLGERTLVHQNLCDPADEAKRSCTKRVSELLTGVAELEPRKPKTKKEKGSKPKAVENEEAA